MSRRIRRVELDGQLEFITSALPVIFVMTLHSGQGSMSFGQSVIQLDSFFRILQRFWKELSTRKPFSSLVGVAVRQTRVSRREIDIQANRGLKKLNGPLKPFGGLRAPMVATLQIELVGFEILGRFDCESRSDRVRELEVELLGDLFGNVGLDAEDVHDCAVVSLRPEHKAIGGID